MPHLHYALDYTADVFIVYQNRVLLRIHDKYKIWLQIGGHVELNEDPATAALREVEEEVGLKVKLASASPELPAEYQSKENEHHVQLPAPFFLNRHAITPTHDHLSFVFFARAETNEVKPGPGEQQDGWRWFTREELADPELNLLSDVRFYAEQALARLAA